MTLRRIPEKFRIAHYNYELLERRGKIALYSQTWTDTRKKEPDQIVGYEIHLIKRSKPHPKEQDKTITSVERLASTNEFGTRGWSYNELQNAKQKMEELRNR